MSDQVKDFLEHKKFDTAERKELTKEGAAMPGGRFPIRNAEDLSNAIRAVGRASGGEKERNEVRRHIIKRAKALNLSDRLPDNWNSDGTLKHSDTISNFLEHFGVKGMKWGVRKDRKSDVEVSATPGRKVKAKGGQGQDASEDAVRVAGNRQKARASSTDALSTKELQEVVTRMNLEQQYANLVANQPSSYKQGQNAVKNVLQTANTANQVIQFVNSPAGKLVRELISNKVRG